jgi:uncharacterized delta-60 repeat protein
MNRSPSRPVSLRLEHLEARETPAIVGALDTSFNTTGFNVFSPGGGSEVFNAVAAQPDGKIIAVGSIDADFLIVRFNPDGTRDTTFNSNAGQVRFDIAAADAFNAVVIQSDGKIVAVGTTDQGDGGNWVVLRRNADGTADGTATVKNLGGTDKATGVALQSDGKIIVTGQSNASTDFSVIRLGTDLSYDATFGVQSVDFGGMDQAYAVGVYPAGANLDQILVVGETSVNSDFAMARLGVNGGLLAKVDPSFGGVDKARTVAFTPTGYPVVVGSSDNDVAVLRVANDALQLDASFSAPDGQGVFDLGGTDIGTSVVVQPDGRIVIGATRSGVPTVMRLTIDGVPDTTFNTAGQQVLPVTAGGTATVGVALQANGRIVVAGTTSGGTDGVVARVIGTVEEGRSLVTSGIPTGTGTVFVPLQTGLYFASPVANITPFTGFTGVVRTAVADVNGDGVQDTVIVSGPGVQTRFAVVSGKDNTTFLINPTDPFGDATFTGGAFVAAGDLDNDGRAEIVISPDQGGGPRVAVISLLSGSPVLRANFFGIDDSNFRGGARVALGDINGDGFQDIAVAAGFLGGPRVALFDGRTVFSSPTRLINDFFGFPGTDSETLRNGAFVSVGDTDGDGKADLILGGGPGGGPRVLILSGAKLATGDVNGAQLAPLANFFVQGNTADRGGVRVAAKDADGDNKAEVVIGSGEGSVSRVRVYYGKNFGAVGEPSNFQDLDPYSAAVLPAGVFVG